jgi:hypothetical protein
MSRSAENVPLSSCSRAACWKLTARTRKLIKTEGDRPHLASVADTAGASPAPTFPFTSSAGTA